MIIELELNGNRVIKPDGRANSILVIEAGKVTRIFERDGVLREEKLGLVNILGGRLKKIAEEKQG